MRKTYSVRKVGTRDGRPHYSAECTVCRQVLVAGHVSQGRAEEIALDHVTTKHPR